MYLPIYLSIYVSIRLSVYLSNCLSIPLSVYLSICELETEAILRDVLEIWKLKAEKRSFCETSFKLESKRRRTKGSVVGEEWCQNAAPLR